jgi:hypothetical protein
MQFNSMECGGRAQRRRRFGSVHTPRSHTPNDSQSKLVDDTHCSSEGKNSPKNFHSLNPSTSSNRESRRDSNHSAQRCDEGATLGWRLCNFIYPERVVSGYARLHVRRQRSTFQSLSKRCVAKRENSSAQHAGIINTPLFNRNLSACRMLLCVLSLTPRFSEVRAGPRDQISPLINTPL